MQRRLAGAAAARRVLHAGVVARPRRPAVLVRRPWMRRGVIAATICSVLLVQQPLARAFLGLDPAGWAVVTQMAALVSEMIAIKRQVENQRDQARAHIYGKIAPIIGKLSIGHGFLNKALDPANSPWLLPGGPVIPELPFNEAPPSCTAEPANPRCMPDEDDVVLPQTVRDNARQLTQTVLSESYGGSVPVHVGEGVNRLFDSVDYYAERTRDDRASAELQDAQRRATLAMAMGVLEEWRGCNRSTEAMPYSVGTVQRPPCFTAVGEGRGETLSDGQVGTEGMLEGLYVMLDFVQNNQEGDASLTQLATIEAHVRLMRGRMQAVTLEMDLADAEQEQQAQLRSEMAQRQRDAVFALSVECSQGNGGGSVYNYLAYNPEDPPASTCVQVLDVSDDQIAALDADVLFSSVLP